MQDSEARIVRTAPGENRQGKAVLYWMQAAQRISYNPALDLAIDKANRAGLPLIVLFCIDVYIPEANLRHFRFMFEGLLELSQALNRLNIPLLLRRETAVDAVPLLAAKSASVVMDSGYLSWQKLMRDKLFDSLGEMRIPLIEVETEPVVPVRNASQKAEYAAATLRPRLLRQIGVFLDRPEPAVPKNQQTAMVLAKSLITAEHTRLGTDFHTVEELENWVGEVAPISRTADPVSSITGGYSKAIERLERFINDDLDSYARLRSDPAIDRQSGMSPYLHFGQISALEIWHRVTQSRGFEAGIFPELIRGKADLSGIAASLGALGEELIIRRELSMNFCHYRQEYARYEVLPLWARTTLNVHRADQRPIQYSLDRLENADTHDPYWNAAQSEMLSTGKMHNYLRMYWGKKVIEWTCDPEEAFYSLLYLNNRYELDGRDANAYAGIAWCFGMHDRPWQSREIFGSVRYMNATGLERKFDMRGYLKRING